MSTIRANNIQGLDAPNPAIELPIDGTVILASGFSGDLESKGTFTASGLTVDSTATFAVGASGTPAITASGDPNTGIYFPAADTIGFAEGGNEAARIDDSGRVLIGTNTARRRFFNADGEIPTLQIEGTGVSTRGLHHLSLTTNNTSSNAGAGAFAVFGRSRGGIGDYTLVNGNDSLGSLSFQGADGTDFVEAARITAQVDTTPGANDMPGRLLFYTTTNGASSPTERMRITSDGRFNFGGAADPGGTKFNIPYGGNDDGIRLRDDVGTGTFINFYANSTTNVGSITHTSSATAYNTSSDYRLKENVVDLDGAIDRVKQLAPKRFNFIADETDTLVDGFLAHEAQTVVPEAVTGTHNEVDDEGDPIYQGIDQSKLVPLLTAALQEAIEKIETLEARLTALESA